MRKPTSFRIVDHGVTTSDSFQGHGVSFTTYTDCATGCGNTFGEALDEALEQLACNGWDVSGIDDPIARQVGEKEEYSAHAECSKACGDRCDFYYYVSVDVGCDGVFSGD